MKVKEFIDDHTDDIKKALSKDNKGSMEGCGFVPQKGRDFQNNPELLEKT